MSSAVIDTLMSEHRRIEKVLFCLMKYVDGASPKMIANRSDLEKFVDFIRNYSDRLHHLKEEDLLFKAMVSNGFPEEDGPIAVMLSDHEECRRYVKILASESDIQKLVHAARSFCELLTQHIHKEDQILYPMALQILPGDRQMVLSEQFDSFREANLDDLRKYEKLADDLFSRYG